MDTGRDQAATLGEFACYAIFLLVPFAGAIGCAILAFATRKPGVRIGAILGAATSGLVLIGAIGVLAVVGLQKVGEKALGVKPARAGAVERFDDLGFQFTHPGDPWKKGDPKRINEQAALVLVRARPERYFMIIAECADHELDPADLAEIAERNLAQAATAFKPLGRTPVVLDGVPGVRFESEATVEGMRFAYVHWVGVRPGRLYQFVMWGYLRDREGLRADSSTLHAKIKFLPTALDGR